MAARAQRQKAPVGRRYERSGLLAIDPKAFFELFFAPPEPIENEQIGDVTVVDIRGPLHQHDDGWCDSYEAISARVATACESACRAIVLRVDSPGGDAAGCFDTARSLRAQCAAAGKPLYAHVDGKACSAAYALASSAEHICLSDAALVGSIGVISCRDDVSAMNAARGLRVAFVTSGARKADGHPDQPITDAELKEAQILVDSMAGVFFELVGEMRGLDAKGVAALDAKLFHGEAAISAGLADDVSSFDELLASIANGDPTMKPQAKADDKDKSPYETARAALEEAAKGEDANAAAAKRALAAMDDNGDKPKDDEPPPADDKDKPKEGAEGDPPEPDDDDEKDKAAADKAVSAISAGQLAATVSDQGKQIKMLMSDREKNERVELFAGRPDLDPALVKALAKTPLQEVKAIVGAIPKPVAPKLAATAVVQGTRGASHVAPAQGDAASEMDARMGLSATAMGVERKGNQLIFGVMPKRETAAKAAGDAK